MLKLANDRIYITRNGSSNLTAFLWESIFRTEIMRIHRTTPIDVNRYIVDQLREAWTDPLQEEDSSEYETESEDEDC